MSDKEASDFLPLTAALLQIVSGDLSDFHSANFTADNVIGSIAVQQTVLYSIQDELDKIYAEMPGDTAKALKGQSRKCADVLTQLGGMSNELTDIDTPRS